MGGGAGPGASPLAQSAGFGGLRSAPQPLSLPCGASDSYPHPAGQGVPVPCTCWRVAGALCWPTPCTPRRDGQCAGRDCHPCPSRGGMLAAEQAGGREESADGGS